MLPRSVAFQTALVRRGPLLAGPIKATAFGYGPKTTAAKAPIVQSSTPVAPNVTDPSPQTAPDPDLSRIVSEEERCLQRVLDHVADRRHQRKQRREVDYDSQLLALRDEIAAARMEDVPPLLEQMERLQGIAARQRALTEGYVDARSPYFGRMVLSENERRREVLIGRSTYVDSKAGVRIVDWRDAPVSRLYYRYGEGEEYEEVFGDREIEGEVLVRRSVTIVEGRLRRVVSPQGTFVRPEAGEWRRSGSTLKLSGGEGTATRAEQHHKPGKLGVGDSGEFIGDDKHLKEITALIDPRQFELLTRPDSGLVVIQGGAGSGKTTIGLHRLAYLAYQDARRFRPDKMLVVVFNDALARYISQVLPALDVNGVVVRTYEQWSQRLRNHLVPSLPRVYNSETPPVVTRLKKNPVVLTILRQYVDELAKDVEQRLSEAAQLPDLRRAELLRLWQGSRSAPLTHRIHGLNRWLRRHFDQLTVAERHALERVVQRGLDKTSDLIGIWADVLTDPARFERAFEQRPELSMTPRELERALAWCRLQCTRLLSEQEEKEEPRAQTAQDDDYGAIDGAALEERAALDVEDDTLFLLLWQQLRGPIFRPGSKEPLVYEHVLVDEAQDLSPLELSVVVGCTSKARSLTLAGDVAQRLYMDNGFLGWSNALAELGLDHVAVEPLKLSYRSTAEIVEFSRAVLGPLAPAETPAATRHGAPVELFRFADLGEAVGFLSEALRDLMDGEPRASVAVIARHPEQADLVYQGLLRSDVPRLRRIAEQDFPFKPGVDVTDVRQVKGLEFDYVVLVEVSDTTYGADDEARHLLHIAATRAAHQLWLLTSGKPSPLIPQELRERSF